MDPTQLTPGEEYPIYMNAVVHHNTNNNLYPNETTIDENIINDILNNILNNLTNISSITLPYIEDCQRHNTFKKPKLNNDWYTLYHLTLKPKQHHISYEDCNQIVEYLYDTFATNTENCTKLTNDENLNNNIIHWTKFISFHLPNVNNTRDTSYGLLVGINPTIHGRHHVACKWILTELFNQTHKYLPTSLKCSNMALFRRTFGVRSGNLKLHGRDYKIYHIHSTDLDNIDHIISALYEHHEETGNHLTIFHRNIIIEKFPKTNDNRGNTDLKRWLEDTELQLKNQVQITLHKHITKNNTSPAINNISKIENLISYTFKLAEKEKFYINLILPKNPSTINLTNDDFKHIFNNDTNTSPGKHLLYQASPS